MKNYVISLTTATNRRKHITDEFGKQGINFEFFDAITHVDIDSICNKLGLENLKRTNNLTSSEKGCFLSHLSLWQKMIDENIDYMAIFEDDVHLGNNAHLFLNNHHWLNDEIGLLKIEHFYTHLNLGNVILSFNQRNIQPLYSVNLGTAGYIIQQTIAKQLLNLFRNTTSNNIVAIDHFIFQYVIENKQFDIFQLNPALCIQSDRLNPTTHLTSNINRERRTRMDNEKKNRNFIHKSIREFNRLLHKIDKISNKMQKIEFK